MNASDVLAIVFDSFGAQEWPIVAPFDGIIVGRATIPLVNEGDATFHLARVASLAGAETALDGLSE